jgi:hypothetical protein
MNGVKWQAYRNEARRIYNELRAGEYRGVHNSFAATKALEIIAEKYQLGFGVEGFCDQNSGEHGVTYINMGDTYSTTILFESDAARFSVGCWGDIVERHEEWYS